MTLKNIKKGLILVAALVFCLAPYPSLAVKTALADTYSQPLSPRYEVKSVSMHTITAYNSLASQCDSTPCYAASGFNLCKNNTEDVIAANWLPFGAKVRIPSLFGDRVFTVEDRMNRRFPDYVDVWMKDRGDAIRFGTMDAMVEVVEEVK
jgi:3D (Asp-Asp-Asp) domain-containing protein